MSFLKTIGSFISTAAAKVGEYAKTALTSKNASGLGSLISTIQGAITAGSSIVNAIIPSPPSGPTEVVNYTNQASDAVAQISEQIRTSQGPAINKVMMLATKKGDLDAALTEVGSKYSNLAVVTALGDAKVAKVALAPILSTTSSKYIDQIETKVNAPSMATSARNVGYIKEKIALAISFLKAFTPASLIAAKGSVAISRLFEWVIDSNFIGTEWRFAAGTASASGMTTPAGVRYQVTSSTGASILKSSVTPTLPAANIFAVLSATQLAKPDDYPTFPPKTDIYDWNIESGIDFAITPTGTTGTMADFGASPLEVIVYAAAVGATKQLVSRQPYAYLAGDTVLQSTAWVKMPMGVNTSLSMDIVIASSVASDFDAVINTYVNRMIGKPKAVEAPVGLVDYLIEDTNGDRIRKFLNGSERWVDLMGKVVQDYPSSGGDPNFCLGALWNARVANNKALIDELSSTLQDWSDATFATSASISDKYDDIKAGLSLDSIANVSTHLFSIGPMGTVSVGNILKLYGMLIDDFLLLEPAFEVDQTLSDKLIADNSGM